MKIHFRLEFISNSLLSMELATVIIRGGANTLSGLYTSPSLMGFRQGHQCFIGTTDGTTGTYIRPEATKYLAFKNRLWALTILSV